MCTAAKRLWIEEDLGPDFRWSYRASSILFSGKSKYQEIDLVDTPTFGKVLLLDGKMQSTESDEKVYHELLVHPTLLHHPCPKTVFIMGGGEGATAREVLRHKTVETLVMADIDQVVVDACSKHLSRNKHAFADPRLNLIIADARAQLESWPHKFDVIIGDLADPLDGGPCYQLYTQEFYQTVVRKKLNPDGVFVTQSGPASFNSCTEVFTCIHKTLASVFPKVLPYAQHIPSFCDTWGYNLAFTSHTQEVLKPEELDQRAAERIVGEMEFLDGQTFVGLCQLNKAVRQALANEQEVYTVDSARFIHGNGIAYDPSGVPREEENNKMVVSD
jgi:thermospermine synthase